jgi:hypothetical protein
MANLITIVYDKKGVDSSMAELLDSAIMESGVYKSTVTARSEYEGFLFSRKLSGQDTHTGLILIGNIENIPLDEITWHYNELGMKYGWNENFAILQVEKKKWNKTELEELMKLFKKLELEEKNDDTGIKKTFEKIGKGINNLPKGLKIAGAVWGTLSLGLLGAAAVTTYLINGKINNDKIFENQQKYLVWKFLTTGLDKFLEEWNK